MLRLGRGRWLDKWIIYQGKPALGSMWIKEVRGLGVEAWPGYTWLLFSKFIDPLYVMYTCTFPIHLKIEIFKEIFQDYSIQAHCVADHADCLSNRHCLPSLLIEFQFCPGIKWSDAFKGTGSLLPLEDEFWLVQTSNSHSNSFASDSLKNGHVIMDNERGGKVCCSASGKFSLMFKKQSWVRVILVFPFRPLDIVMSEHSAWSCWNHIAIMRRNKRRGQSCYTEKWKKETI